MTYAWTQDRRRGARGFSLLEVLIATLILGIGLIMVASIFPVGAKWSQEGAEETIAQNVALNAVSIIKTKYFPTGSPSLFTVTGVPGDAYYTAGSWLHPGSLPNQRVFSLPNFGTTIRVSERTYAVGMGQPFPVPLAKCSQAQYFWTALMKVPSDNSTTITLYILVFRRGDVGQTFSTTVASSLPSGVGPVELTDCRQASNANEQLINGTPFTPSVAIGTYQTGTLSSGQVINAFPQVGSFGIGANSGTVFRQVVNLTGSTEYSTPSPLLIGQTTADVAPTEKVIGAVPPDGWPDSPLIYVYQTQLSF